MRKAKLHRKTAETEIRIALTIEGRGKYEVSTGIRFLDHMLELFARHGGFDLRAERRIGYLYPKARLPNGSEATVIAWLWARTVRSPDPAAKG